MEFAVKTLLYEDLFLKNYKIPDIPSCFRIGNETLLKQFFQIVFDWK